MNETITNSQHRSRTLLTNRVSTIENDWVTSGTVAIGTNDAVGAEKEWVTVVRLL